MPSDTDRIGSATNGGGGGGGNGLGPPGLGGIGSPAKAPGAAHPPPELVKYGELIILGYNGQLPQGEITLGFHQVLIFIWLLVITIYVYLRLDVWRFNRSICKRFQGHCSDPNLQCTAKGYSL